MKRMTRTARATRATRAASWSLRVRLRGLLGFEVWVCVQRRRS